MKLTLKLRPTKRKRMVIHRPTLARVGAMLRVVRRSIRHETWLLKPGHDSGRALGALWKTERQILDYVASLSGAR